MVDKIKGKLKAHLEQVGASDLAARGVIPHVGSITLHSEKNRSVALRIEHGKAQMLYGLNDPNFAPAQISYDDNGNPDAVTINNSSRSGHQVFKPEDNIVNAILTAARSQPTGKGYAVAALAKAANASNAQGDNRWGVGLISSAAHMDTANLEATHNAIAAVQRKWNPAFVST